MKVTFLMDNEPVNGGILCEHGFSCWIETKSAEGQALAILFDTAKTDRYLTNASRLGIDIKANRYTLISHGHNDHGGGLAALLAQAPYSQIYLSEQAFEPHVKGDEGEKYFYAEASIGLNTRLLTSHRDNFKFINERTMLEKNIYLETELDEPYARPANNRLCQVGNNETMIKDDFAHEIYLTVQEKDYLYIFTGCAHRGAVNIMAMAQERYPSIENFFLIGGFHLSKESNNTQIDLIKTFISQSPASWHLVTGHCTGMKAFEVLKEKLDCPVEYAYGGSSLVL